MRVLPARDAYQILAEKYDSSPNALIALEQRIMTPLLPVTMNRHIVVDVAAGTGRWAFQCRKRGARVIAADFCREMLRKASRPPIQIDRVQADAECLPLPNASADVVICAFALGYAPACFAELARITRPGGTILVSDVHPEALNRGWTRSFRHIGE